MVLKNIANLSRKLIGLLGEIEYSRASLIPADKESAITLWETEHRKSVFPLDCALGVDVLPFKVSCQMMCAIAKEAVRSRSYSDASANIAEKFHIAMSSVQVEKVTDYVGELVFLHNFWKPERLRSHIIAKLMDGVAGEEKMIFFIKKLPPSFSAASSRNPG